MDIEALKTKYLDNDFKLKGEFVSGDQYREEILNRCERYAGWTIPTIFPDDPLLEYDEMQNDFQSVGAQAVTNLSNKIMMALFRPSKPFFKMQLSKEQKQQVIDSGLQEAEIEAALAAAEREGMRELDKMNARVVLNDAVTHLIITGNGMLFTPKNDHMQLYSLRDYTIKRDLRGNLVKSILRETKAVVALSDELAALAESHGYSEKDEVSLYTGIQRVGKDKYFVWQELEDICYCHKKVGVYTKDTLPWIPLVWNRCRGKDYGTGLVETYAGDFHTLSTLAEAILDFGTLMTDVKTFVNPTGQTDVREVTEAPSGAYVYGKEEDLYVHSPQVNNASDFLQNRFDAVERRIAAAFLLNTSVTRNAERVTAEEIRMQAQELEGSLGGIYSRQAVEMQLPLAKRITKRMDKVFDKVETTIVTGFEALSRNSELDNVKALLGDLAAVADLPEEAAKRIDYGNLIALLGAGRGVEYSKFLKSEDVVKQEDQARIQQEAAAAGAQEEAVVQAQATGNPE